MDKWPNFFIVGAPRSGSTSLYEYLNNVKGIYMSKIKEPFFFHAESWPPKNSTVRPKQRVKDVKKYLNLFKNAKEYEAVGEASTTYLWDPQSSKLIHDKIPKARIIILLRDPVERAFSHFLHVSKFNEDRNFYDIISRDINKTDGRDLGSNYCLDPGLYSIHLKRFWKIFGRIQVKIMIYEEFFKDVKPGVKEILNFLNVDSDVPELVDEAYNRFQIPRGRITRSFLNSETIGLPITKLALKILPHNIRLKFRKNILLKDVKKPKLPEEERLALENFYLNDVRELELLLKRKLPWDWLKKYRQEKKI